MDNVIIVFWNLGIGGIQKKIVDLSNYIVEKDYNLHLHIILRNKTDFRLDGLINPQKTSIYYRPEWFGNKIRIQFPLYILWKLWRLNPISVLTFLDKASTYTIIASKILFWKRTRVILNEDTYPSLKSPSLMSRVLIKLFYPQADQIILPTKAAQIDLVNYFGIPIKNTLVIPNWTLSINKDSVNKKKIDILYVGRFTEQKNLFFLLNTILRIKRHYPNIKLCLVGEGEDQILLLEFIRKNKLKNNIEIISSIPDISLYYQSAKIFTLTSNYEGMSVALLEAMAARVAILVKSFYGVEEYLITQKTALIASDIQDYANKAILLVNDDKFRKKLGDAACRFQKKNYSEAPIKQYLQLLTNT